MRPSLMRERIMAAFSDLKFEQKRHIYTLEGRILPSVSKLVESHCDKFNPNLQIKTRSGTKTLIELCAAKASREEGRVVTVHETQTKWNNKRDLRCDIGTTTHDFLEKYTGIQRPKTPWEVAGVKFFNDMSHEYDVLFREVRMHSREYAYAGTEDLVLIHRENGHIIAADYKTNEDLFRQYKSNTLKEPFEWAAETPYNKYQLQLSYYQIIFEEVGLHVDDRWLVYLQEDGNYKIYKTVNLVLELKEYLWENRYKIAA